MKRIIFLAVVFTFLGTLQAQEEKQWQGKFEQLGQELPTPNVFRAADGAPGPDYWQQRADYKINLILNDENQSISGQQTVTYYNNSPQPLEYLWLQLDQNMRKKDSDAYTTRTGAIPDSVASKMLMYVDPIKTTKGGFNIQSVTDSKGKKLSYFIQKTMMRIDLPKALKKGQKFSFNVAWSYFINNRMEDYGRSGFEYFPEDGNYLYTIAQFYPRMAVYDDYEGWQNKQFLGAGEFALTFGNYDVKITVPSDHILMATGELQNAKKVLSKSHYQKYTQAQNTYDRPVIIVSQDEAVQAEKSRSSQQKTWHFKAENVRDFGFATSRKFIWDAQAVKIGDKTTLAQSLYPKEGNPLWEKESTLAVVNTLKIYSKYSIDYPYPHATSIHAASIGMEYPMICFNFGRPHPDGSYTDAVKYNMIGVIIHEIGHNFFPMIVNSDERQWTWMDEGLNTFLEFLTEQECYENFPSSMGPASTLIPYMKGDKKYIRPIMTNSEQVIQLGWNAYGKPSAALNILREVVMGREAFDKAFKVYSERWAFKHPKPADFFRTMEDASGIDLDWFWRGWFYTIDNVDIAVDTMIWFQLDVKQQVVVQKDKTINSGPSSNVIVEKQDGPKPFKIIKSPGYYYGEFRERMDEEALKDNYRGKHIYQLDFSNIGGLVMPLLIEFEFESGRKQIFHLPVEIWRQNENKISKGFVLDEKVKTVRLDPDMQTADVDPSNNVYPREKEVSKFDQFKQKN